MLWHNKEAAELAGRVQKVVNAWNAGSICPSEFLYQLDYLVASAMDDKTSMRDYDLHKARIESLSKTEFDTLDTYVKHRSECKGCIKPGTLCDIGIELRQKWNTAFEALSKEVPHDCD